MYLRVKSIDLPLSVIFLWNCPIILFVLIIFNLCFYEISPMYEINRSTFVVTCFPQHQSIQFHGIRLDITALHNWGS